MRTYYSDNALPVVYIRRYFTDRLSFALWAGHGSCEQHSTPCTGRYAYTQDLMELLRRVLPTSRGGLPADATSVNTPLKPTEFAALLREHPDLRFRRYILEGIRGSFRVALIIPDTPEAEYDVSREAPTGGGPVLGKGAKAGQSSGPPGVCAIPSHSHRVIPKNHQPGEWHLIVDLSYPAGASINDGIESALCSLKYPSVDDAVRRLLAKDPCSFMVKIDIESAY